MRRSSIIDATWYQRPAGCRERMAAGGVVVRREGERILVALTRDIGAPDFILPKGGVEKGETLQQTARREISEEAGIERLKLLAPLGARSRLSFNKRRWTTTHYFLFSSDQIEFARTAADQYGAAWFNIDYLPGMLWPEQRELIETNREMILRLLHLTTGN